MDVWSTNATSASDLFIDMPLKMEIVNMIKLKFRKIKLTCCHFTVLLV